MPNFTDFVVMKNNMIRLFLLLPYMLKHFITYISDICIPPKCSRSLYVYCHLTSNIASLKNIYTILKIGEKHFRLLLAAMKENGKRLLLSLWLLIKGFLTPAKTV